MAIFPRITAAVCILLTPLAGYAANDNGNHQVLDFDKGYTATNSFVIDLADAVSTDIIPEYSGRFYVKIINMVPAARDSYQLALSSSPIMSAPFARDNPIPGPRGVDEAEAVDDPCDELYAQAREVRNAANESAVKTEREALDALLFAKQSLRQCPEYWTTMDYLNEATSQIVAFSVEKSREYRLEIKKAGNTVRSVTVTGETREWLTHFGFTFVYDRGRGYYSERVTHGATTQYRISEQRDTSQGLYAATAMFSVPWLDTGTSKFAHTAGLGASNDTILVYFGQSWIIQDNFMMSVGIIVQEFDELSGNYTEGELRDTPLDSSNLTSSTYKPSVAFTFGYRFGQ